jgi:hypothetical protein
VGLPSGVLAALLGPRGVFAAAMVLPVLVIASVVFIPRWREAPARVTQAAEGPLGGGRARWSCWSVSATRSVSAALLSLLLVRIGVTRAVVVAAVIVFIFRATPDVGQGYSYWAIDRLAFDERFLGLACSTACTNGSASPPEAWR